MLLWAILLSAALPVPTRAARVLRFSLARTDNATAAEGGGNASESGGKEYVSFGCFRSPQTYQAATTITAGFALDRCFAKCSTTEPAVSYFGLASGDRCWCGDISIGASVPKKECDIECGAGSGQKCGGTIDTVSSVYRIIDCYDQGQLPGVIQPYSSFDGESCGSSNASRLEIDGSETLLGSVDECKAACTHDPAMQCHGFTYEGDQGRCTFHLDVNGGDVVKQASMTCYFKVLV